MLSLALARQTWGHRLPAWLKLVALLGLSIALFPVGDPLVLGAALAVVLALTASLGPDALRQTGRFLIPLWPMLALLLAFHLLFADLADGIVIAVRLLTLVMLANIVTMTTALSDMMHLVERVLSPLKSLGVNVRAISVAMGLVIRFTPVLLQRAHVLLDSWRARSHKRARWHIVVPIGLSVFNDAEQVSDALRARGGITQLNRNP